MTLVIVLDLEIFGLLSKLRNSKKKIQYIKLILQIYLQHHRWIFQNEFLKIIYLNLKLFKYIIIIIFAFSWGKILLCKQGKIIFTNTICHINVCFFFLKFYMIFQFMFSTSLINVNFIHFINKYLFMDKLHHKSNWSMGLIDKHSPQNL